MSRRVRPLFAGVLLCAALAATAGCAGHGGGSGVAPAPSSSPSSSSGLGHMERLVNDAQSAASAADSDAANN